MKLEEIGFYTLSDERALNSSSTSPVARAELILTDKCNFKCPYCQGIREDFSGTQHKVVTENILYNLFENGLENVRFSGGEPMTQYKDLIHYVNLCRMNNVKHIAISTNGSFPLDFYKALVEFGVNDFSISLDSGCCAVGDKMAGNINGSWNTVVKNIEELSKLTYVTVGMVFTEENIDDAINAIEFAHSLGVADIRIISAAQYNKGIKELSKLDKEILDAHPILKYRVQNDAKNRSVRGITRTDSNKCHLVLDDLVIVQGYHFPCVIHMRQKGNPIGKMGFDFRKEREEWFKNHNAHEDPICRENCLDVCVDYNNCAIKRK